MSGTPGTWNSFAGIDRIPGRLRPFIAVPRSGGPATRRRALPFSGNRMYSSRRLMPDLVVRRPPDARLRKQGFADCRRPSRPGRTASRRTSPPRKIPWWEAYAGGALALLREALLPGIRGTADETGRVALANAAVYAACAFSICPLGPAPSSVRPVARVANISAGAAMGLLLPSVAARLAGRDGRDVSRLLLPLAGMDRFAATAEEERSRVVPALLGRMLADVLAAAGGHVPLNLKEAGLARERIPDLAGNTVSGEKSWTAEDSRAVLEEAWNGKRAA